MKTLKTLIMIAGAFVLLAAGGLYAQARATASIPFEFTVQNTTLPAGDYTISPASATSHDVLAICNSETRQKLFVMAPATNSEYKGPADKNVVLFHKIGDRYFLAEVKTDAVHGHLYQSKMERELTLDGGPIAAVIVPALNVR